MDMKNFCVTIALVWLCVAPLFGASWQQVDSLLNRFERQRGGEKVATAKALFRLMTDEGVIDEQPREALMAVEDSVKLWVYYGAGELALDAQQYQQGIRYTEMALTLCPEGSPQRLMRSDCLALLAIHHFRLSQYEEALIAARGALALDRITQDKSRISSSLNTLAGICLAARQPKEGEPYILEAIGYSTQAGDSSRLAIQEGMASEIYMALERAEEALHHAQRAYAINHAQGLEGKAAIRLCQIASAQRALGQSTEAEASLLQAIPLLERSGNRQSLAIANNQLGYLLLDRGDSAAAALCFRQALAIFTEHGDLYNECQSHWGLSQALKEASPTEASDHLSRYAALKDTLYQRGMASELNHYNAAYKNSQLEAMHTAERQQKHLYLICAMVFLLLLVAVAVALYLTRRHRRALQRHVEELLGQLKRFSAEAEPSVMAESDAEPSAAKRVSESTVASAATEVSAASDEAKLGQSTFLQQVTEAMMLQISDGEVDLQQLASQFFITRPQLNRKIKALTGLSTTSYITSLRVAKAKELMRNSPSLSIADVAMQCGISDVSYFISIFKKATGQTPGQWRMTGE